MIEKIKNYHPSLKICFLYFIIPIIVAGTLAPLKEGDIWFLIKHGEYVLNNGFPHIEFLSMHSGFHFVMQQWLSSVIFYLTFHFLGVIGLKFLIQIVNILILFLIYKLCMLVSGNKYRLSIFTTIIIDILLLLFMLPRPWIFTFIILLTELYILESFYRKKSKIILLLPLLSLIQINMHSSMWLMLIVFMLPFIVNMIFDKNKDVLYLIGMIPLMLLVGFINPYGIENMLYVFNSYNQKEISLFVVEMHNTTVGFGQYYLYGDLFFGVVFILTMIYILAKKGTIKIRFLLLTVGTMILALMNIRSIPLFIIGGIFPITDYLSPYFKNNNLKDKIDNKKYGLLVGFLIIYALGFTIFTNNKIYVEVKDGIDELIKVGCTDKDPIYINYDYGSYAEYMGLRPYIDTRAEVYLKKMNHKEDIFLEYGSLITGNFDYNEFINKYNFKYLVIFKSEILYDKVAKDERYKIIYNEKDYSIFSSID